MFSNYSHLQEGWDKEEERKINLLYGLIQSGKTEALLSTCYKTQETGLPTVFLIPNLSNGWYSQLQSRISQFNEKWKVALDPLYVGEYSVSSLSLLLKKKKNRVLICLANYAQLERCVNVVEKIHLVVDEADQMYKEMDTVFYPLFQDLLQKSHRVFVVSATTFKLWFEADVQTTTAHRLPVPDRYKGIQHFEFQWTNRANAKYKSITKEPVSTADIGSETWLTSLLEDSKERFVYYRNGTMLNHPVIALYKGTDEIALHGHIQTEWKSNFPQMTTFTYDSKGIMLYSPALKESFLTIKEERVRERNGKYLFCHTSVSEMLQFLKENGGAERFPIIVIIAGKLANRMFSFVSEDYEWHLTHQRLYLSPTADCTTVLQSIRLCGIYQDDIPLTLSCDIELYQSIRKSFQLQQELYDKITDETRQIELKEFVKEGHVKKEQIPKRKLVAGHSYNREIGTIEPEQVNENVIDGEEEQGLTLFFRMLREKRDTAYLRIINLFHIGTEDEREDIERSELVEKCKLVNFCHYTRWNLSRHNQYKLLVKTTGKKYKIHPQIVEWIKENW